MKQEKSERLKYIRTLDKFASRVIGLLKDQNCSYDDFIAMVQKNFTLLQEVEAVRLDSVHLVKLEEFVGLLVKSLDIQPREFEQKKDEIIKESNLLHKQKTQNRYKKNKHKQSDFYDGY